MLPRERVLAAVKFQPVDVVPLRIYAAAGGLHEHGARLADLIRETGHDFGPLGGVAVPEPPPPADYDDQGRYDARRTDEWGSQWRYRTFGVWGMVTDYPLAELDRLDGYRFPPRASAEGEGFGRARAAMADHRRRYFHLDGGGSLFEKLHSLRPFDDVLVDIYQDAPAINRLADRLVEHWAAQVARALALGADGVAFGDDFGTQQAPFFPLAVWRQFFRPRYERLFAPIRQAGKAIFFHSCGQITPILEDLAELGVNVLWPQLPLWEPAELARICRSLGLAVELHPDRGELMQRGTPEQVRRNVRELVEAFDTRNGGSILYLEVDPGFPWPNVQALFETAQALRA